jgi:pimeloyl-ACP methyl ester carboxylesterase
MTHATINGVDLFYAAQGTGEPVIFNHGYTGSHDNFEAAVTLLAPRYRCVVMDCRGAGDSARPESGHTIEQYAADVVGMADHLGLDRFTYVGHSMGGVIGMELGINHASRLNKLVLVAPAPADGVRVPPGVRERALALREAQDRETLLRERKALSARYRPEQAHLRSLERALSVSGAHYNQSWEALVSSARGDRLGEITVPTLMIAGAADGLLSANLADFRRLPNATLHVFSRVSHGIPYEVPEAFAEVVADFIENGVVTAATLQAAMLAATPSR